MSNHPNRGKLKYGRLNWDSASNRCRNPRPAEIRRAREMHGLTQTEAADLVCASLHAWQQWEAGERRMHPAFWRLFLLEVDGHT